MKIASFLNDCCFVYYLS